MFSFFERPQIPYERVLVMGDIHGMSHRFFSLMDDIAFDCQKDLLILLGDYIDRGDGSLFVLTYVKGLVGDGNCIALRGNHEDMRFRPSSLPARPARPAATRTGRSRTSPSGSGTAPSAGRTMTATRTQL